MTSRALAAASNGGERRGERERGVAASAARRSPVRNYSASSVPGRSLTSRAHAQRQGRVGTRVLLRTTHRVAAAAPLTAYLKLKLNCRGKLQIQKIQKSLAQKKMVCILDIHFSFFSSWRKGINNLIILLLHQSKKNLQGALAACC